MSVNVEKVEPVIILVGTIDVDDDDDDDVDDDGVG